MRRLLIIIYGAFYSKIPNWVLQKWVTSQRISLLEVVAKKGHYKNRIYIAEHISSLHINGQHKLINILLDDPVEYISQKIIESSKSLRLLDELKDRILEKKNYWFSLKKQR